MIRSSFFSGLLPLFVMAHFAHHLLTAIPIPLLPMIRNDLALDYTQSGLLLSAFSLTYGISQLLMGWLADRIGPRIMITIDICGLALAGLLIGLSQNYVMLLVCFVMMGILGGGYHPAAPPLLSAGVEPKKRGRVLGIHAIGGSASFFLAPLVAVAIAAAWSWQGSFIGLAIPTLAFGIVFYVLLGRLADVRKVGNKVTVSDSETPSTPRHLRLLVSFLILSISTHAVIFSVTAFIPLFMVDRFGVGEEAAGALIALIYSAGLWAAPLGGYLSDRLGRVPVILATCLIAGPVIYLLNLVPYGLGMGVLLLAIGMVRYTRNPVSEAYIISHTSERRRSTIFGIYYFASAEGGGILSPVIGYLIDQLGFHSTFTIAAVALVVVTLACSIFLRGSRD